MNSDINLSLYELGSILIATTYIYKLVKKFNYSIDKYAEKKQYLKALKLYILAHNDRKAEPIYDKIAKTLSVLIKSN